MKNKVNTFTVILFLAGLSVLLYPYISNQWNTKRQNELIVHYEEQMKNQQEEEKMNAEWEKAWKFNSELLPMILPDSFAEAELLAADPEYMNCLNLFGDGIMGTIDIPKINVHLPIYHTTGSDVLELGAGHLHGSSLPAGGINSHAVISAHRGLPTAVLFTDLDQLQEGDHFLLYVLDETMCYEVDQIKVVEPSETEDLNVIEGMDLVTLLTCTPYGVNSHRLLVRGHRVPYEEEVVKEEEEQVVYSIYTNYKLWISGGISLTALLAVILGISERIHMRKVQKQQNSKE